MAFNTAQYQAAIDDLTAGLTKLSGKIQEVPPAVDAATNHWYILSEVADAIRWLGDKLMELGSWILDKLKELLEGAAAPVLLFVKAWDWQDVRDLANGVAANIKPDQLTASDLWHGSAASAYSKQIPPQGNAASRIGTMADKTATALEVCAGAGLAFYLALGIILVKFIAAFITALVALGSVVFSEAGAALIVEEAGVNTGLILAAVGALLTLLGAQATQMTTLHGEANDPTNFPGGHWPDATPGRFSDATVTDGDADWSLQA
jgi:hypothetical protein